MKNSKPLFGRESNGMNQILGTPKMDRYGDARQNPLDSVVPASQEVVRKIRNAYEDPVPYLAPRHLEAPEGARTLELNQIVNVLNGGSQILYSFTCPLGSTTVIYGYSLFAGTFTVADYEWIPTVDGRRVLQYHGTPMAIGYFKMGTPIANNFFMGDLIKCQILLEPGQVFQWNVRNNTGAATLMGARTSGYVDMSQRLTASKFGD